MKLVSSKQEQRVVLGQQKQSSGQKERAQTSLSGKNNYLEMFYLTGKIYQSKEGNSSKEQLLIKKK